MGLDPRTPGSLPGLKAGAQPLSHPGGPSSLFLKVLAHVNNQLELYLGRYTVCLLFSKYFDSLLGALEARWCRGAGVGLPGSESQRHQ